MKDNAKSKHICNLHKPSHRPKIAKELALPTQTKQTKWRENNTTENKGEVLTAVLQKIGFSG